MALVAAEPTALDVLYGLILESGEPWGSKAEEFQIADAEAIFDPAGPCWHYLTRPRGGSKTSDTAAIALAWLAAEATPRQRSFVLAVSEDQARELIDAAAGFVARSPVIGDYVAVEGGAVYAANGASVQVLTSGDSTWGKGRDTGFIVLDEFAQWPETRKSRRTWVSMLSATQKTPGLRLIILTSAGEPGHFSYGVLKEAKEGKYSSRWRVSETPGPVPWVDLDAVRAQSPFLTDAEFARLHLNQWTEESDRLLTEADWDAVAVLRGPQEPRRGVRYVVTVDLGVKIDPTVIVVSHAETMEDGRHKRVVVDRLERYVPNQRRKQEVQLGQTERRLYELSVEFNNAPIHGDPSQFHAMKQSLSLLGRKVHEFKFTPSSVGELASSLVQAVRNQQLWLPNNEDLRDELLNVHLRSTSPGVYRLDHDARRHDDQAVAIGMAVHIHLAKAGLTSAAQFVQLVQGAAQAPEQEDPATRLVRQTRERQERKARQAQRKCQHRWRPDGTCAWGCGISRCS